MKISRKKKIILLILITFVIVLHFGFKGCREFHSMVMAIGITTEIDTVVASYIENEGAFPESENTLVERGYIRKIKSDKGYDCFYKSDLYNPDNPDAPRGWYKIWDFDLFTIYYGADFNDIEVKGGLLYSKTTGKQILLLDGPYNKNLKEHHYEPISMKWYKLMAKDNNATKD